MASSFDTVVIGGGIVGWSAADRLVRHGVRVAVIDESANGQATAAGAGIVSPGTSIRSPKQAAPLLKAAVEYYPTLVSALAEDGETNTGFASPGTLFVFQNDEEYSRLTEIREFAEGQREGGFKSVGDVSVLSGAEAKQHFPPLADIPGALHLSEGSRVDGRLLRDALRRASIARGAVEIAGHAEIRDGSSTVRQLNVEAESVTCDSLLIAGGAWTRGIGETMGVDVPVSPQRGQIIHLDVPATDTSRWSIIHGFHNHYLLTFPTNRVVVGATREDDSGFDFRMTAGGVYQELGEALRVAPGLSSATLAEIRIGFRPSSGDTLPILGRVPNKENVYVATGHGPSGLTLGPVSGAAVADVLLGIEPCISLDAFSPSRFN